MKDVTKNWIASANYDFKTAEAMLNSNRYIYVVFICHLSIEKMIKAIISTEINDLPPKSHNLLYLAKKASIQFSEVLQEFVEQLDNVSISTRYPEDLKRLSKEVNKRKANDVFCLTKKALKWLKKDKRLKI